MSSEKTKYSGAIAWMTQNHVAANLLMLILLIGGFFSVLNLKQEIFPEFDLDIVTISCPYPGASPTEVEQGILLVVEEAIRAVDGVKKISSTAREGVGMVTVELDNDAQGDKVLSDVKNAVDRITSFPEEMETPSVALASRKISVISVMVSGNEEHETLHEIAEKVRRDLLQRKDISQVELSGVKPLEISVEISRENLEAYGLSLGQVAQQIRAFSVELPGGSVETQGGTVLVRVADRRLFGDEFRNITLRGTTTGQEVRLGDIATITDGYADVDLSYNFNGKEAVAVNVYRVGKETPNKVAKAVKSYLKESEGTYPASIKLTPWDDNSELLQGRIDLLVRNAKTGLLLVIIVLAMFLQKRLALWVALGIPISFFGTFLLMPVFDASINMITLFALIITLGMVVDDAIVIAENVYHKMTKGIPFVKAAIEGTQEMAMPVTFSILTTVAAFFPLLLIPGTMGKVFFLIPVIVIMVLVFSWIESFFVLPAHLAHGSAEESSVGHIFHFLDIIQEKCNDWLQTFIKTKYQPALRWLIGHRYPAISGAIALLIIVGIGLPGSGKLGFRFFPDIDGDIVTADMRLPYGIAVERTEEMAKILYDGAMKTLEDMNAMESYRGTFIIIGESAAQRGPGASAASSGSHLLSMQIDLGSGETRSFSSKDFSKRWKENLPPLAGVESFTVGSFGGPSGGKDVDVKLSHSNIEVLGEASVWLAKEFQNIAELTDIENNYSGGKPQLDFSLRPGALASGVTGSDVALALRNSFYGAEALREQRGRNEVKVMVRLPEDQRSSEYDIEQLLVSTRSGSQVPLGTVASMTRGTAPTEINREDGMRQVRVSADIMPGTMSGSQMISNLTGKSRGPRGKKMADSGDKKFLLKELTERYPGITYSFGGQRENMQETFGSLGPNFLLALFVIFTLLAIPFGSYIQPFIVMTAIPFGIVGAFLGHVMMGYSLSIMSIMGIIALSGVVVNDSLVLVDAANKYRKRGEGVVESLVLAGMRRFRPIMLTSLTTFFGLLPMIFEKSMQAKFLIPMAISLGFGILFVTVIVLLLIPVLYIWLERILLFRSRKLYEWGKITVEEYDKRVQNFEGIAIRQNIE